MSEVIRYLAITIFLYFLQVLNSMKQQPYPTRTVGLLWAMFAGTGIIFIDMAHPGGLEAAVLPFRILLSLFTFTKNTFNQ